MSPTSASEPAVTAGRPLASNGSNPALVLLVGENATVSVANPWNTRAAVAPASPFVERVTVPPHGPVTATSPEAKLTVIAVQPAHDPTGIVSAGATPASLSPPTRCSGASHAPSRPTQSAADAKVFFITRNDEQGPCRAFRLK
jgi:hypothetical protein